MDCCGKEHIITKTNTAPRYMGKKEKKKSRKRAVNSLIGIKKNDRR